MPTLAQMMQAKNKQKDSSGDERSTVDEANIPDSGTSKAIDSTDAPNEPVQSNQPDKLAPSQASAQTTKPVGFKLGGIKLGGVQQHGGSDSTLRPDSDQAAESSGSDLSGESRDSDIGSAEAPVGTASLSLTDIAGLTDSSEQESLITIDAVDPESGEGYLDEVPATAPERELPPEMTDQMKGFVDSLDAIYRLHDDPEMFANVVRKIMSEMQDNPALVELLADQDSNALIRGLRQHAGLAQVKKQESKAKRAGNKSSKPQSAVMDSVMSTLQGLAGFDGGFD